MPAGAPYPTARPATPFSAPDGRPLRSHLRYAAPALWALLLLFLGTRPGDALPVRGLLHMPGADKVLHALAYGVLGALVAHAAGPRRAALVVLLGALSGLLWGMLDEWVQGHVPGRTRSWTDLLADIAGAAGGAWLGWRLHRSLARARSVTMPGSSPRGEGS